MMSLEVVPLAKSFDKSKEVPIWKIAGYDVVVGVQNMFFYLFFQQQWLSQTKTKQPYYD